MPELLTANLTPDPLSLNWEVTSWTRHMIGYGDNALTHLLEEMQPVGQQTVIGTFKGALLKEGTAQAKQLYGSRFEDRAVMDSTLLRLTLQAEFSDGTFITRSNFTDMGLRETKVRLPRKQTLQASGWVVRVSAQVQALVRAHQRHTAQEESQMLNTAQVFLVTRTRDDMFDTAPANLRLFN
jgi:hypothetical protein